MPNKDTTKDEQVLPPSQRKVSPSCTGHFELEH